MSKATVWELPRDGSSLYVLIAPRAAVEALASARPDPEALQSPELIRQAVDKLEGEKGLFSEVPAACLIADGVIISRVKDIDNKLIVRSIPATGWDDDEIAFSSQGGSVGIESKGVLGSGADSVELRQGLKEIPFLPLDDPAKREQLTRRIDNPRRAAVDTLVGSLLYAVFGALFIAFGPTIERWIQPVLDPVRDVSEDLPEFNGRQELYAVIMEKLQIDHIVDSFFSLTGPLGALIVPVLGVGVAVLVTWNKYRQAREYYADNGGFEALE